MNSARVFPIATYDNAIVVRNCLPPSLRRVHVAPFMGNCFLACRELSLRIRREFGGNPFSYRSRQSQTSSYLSRNVRSASRNPNLLYRAIAGFCGVVVLRHQVCGSNDRGLGTSRSLPGSTGCRLPELGHISSAIRSRLSSATSFRRGHSRHSCRSGGISANVVGPMTCTVPTIRSFPLSEGTVATQLAEASCMTSSGAEVPSAFHLLSPASLAWFALSYIASTSASSPGTVRTHAPPESLCLRLVDWSHRTDSYVS